MREITDFIIYIKNNFSKILAILIGYLTVAVYLGNVNYYYIDDISRRVNGSTGFGEHYARYFSEYSSYLVQGSGHLTDLGLTTYILSAIVLTFTSSLAIYILSENRQITWSAAIASLFIGLNPWSLELLSFRFDTPYMMISLLVSFLPFLWYHSNKVSFGVSSVISIFIMFNSYQASSGLYIILVLLVGMLDFLKTLNLKEHIFTLITSAIYYAIALGAYFIEMKFNPQLANRGDNASIAALGQLPFAIVRNLRTYLLTYLNELPYLWKLLIIIIILVFIIKVVYNYKKNKVINFIVVIIYSLMAMIFSLGVYVASATDLADDRPRYAYGLAIMIALFMIYIVNDKKNSVQNILGKISVLLLSYYVFSFSLAYIAALDNQKTDFEVQATILAASLNKYVKDDNNTVNIDRLFEDSPAYTNTQLNYPILDNLVPSNQLLYWPNIMWYNEITHSNVNFVSFDFSATDLTTFELLESSYNFDIYQKDNQIYVHMK